MEKGDIVTVIGQFDVEQYPYATVGWIDQINATVGAQGVVEKELIGERLLVDLGDGIKHVYEEVHLSKA